ncbi:MAG: hypothetical protein AVO38_15825 [delta proteobacterium ML8_D]|nr:MAG: hypothetical protein AVO38_15825 [delta proteobacterium ML8_D]
MKHQGKIQDISIYKTDRPLSVGDNANRPDPAVYGWKLIRDRHLFSCWWRQDKALIFRIRIAGDQSPVPAL